MESYARFAACAQSTLGQLVLLALSAAFFYHLTNGIRHLLGDMGLFLDIKDAYKTGRIVIGVSILLTAIVWLKAYGVFL
jgi:succinate dehydrogenase / fumarate reductase cytochrome b subunit